jgi:transposase
MIKLEFKPGDVEDINDGRFTHPHHRVRKRLEVLWLKSQGLPHSEIRRLGQVSEATLVRYLKLYREGGLDKVRELRFYKQKSELEQYTLDIKVHFQDHPPATVKEAMGAIEKITGLKRSEVAVGHFLSQWDCVPGKSARSPAIRT